MESTGVPSFGSKRLYLFCIRIPISRTTKVLLFRAESTAYMLETEYLQQRTNVILKEYTMRRVFLLLAVFSLVCAGSVMAMEGMDHGDSSEGGTFTHMAMAGNVHAEFKIMDMASMNMKDPNGKTHHVMVTFTRNGQKLSKVVGKIKLISPSKKDQVADLKEYGGGVFAAMFSIDEPGKWGVICVFKDETGTQTIKFWYPHMVM